MSDLESELAEPFGYSFRIGFIIINQNHPYPRTDRLVCRAGVPRRQRGTGVFP